MLSGLLNENLDGWEPSLRPHVESRRLANHRPMRLVSTVGLVHRVGDAWLFNGSSGSSFLFRRVVQSLVANGIGMRMVGGHLVEFFHLEAATI